MSCSLKATPRAAVVLPLPSPVKTITMPFFSFFTPTSFFCSPFLIPTTPLLSQEALFFCDKPCVPEPWRPQLPLIVFLCLWHLFNKGGLTCCPYMMPLDSAQVPQTSLRAFYCLPSTHYPSCAMAGTPMSPP